MEETKQKVGVKKACGVMGLALFAMLIVSQSVSAVATILLQQYFPSFFNQPYAIWVISYLPLYLIAVPVFALIVKTIPSNVTVREKVSLHSNTFVKWMLISFAAMYIFNIVSIIITGLIGIVRGTPVINPIQSVQASSGLIYNVIFAVILAPLGEEIIFRGILYRKLGGYGDKLYIVISALCFAMFHANLSQFFYAFALGAIFAYITARTGSIKYAVIMHVVINAWGMLIAPLASSNEIAIYALSMLILAITVFGCVLLYKTFKKGFIFTESEQPLPEKPIRAALLNVGMGLYLVSCSALILVVTFII